MRTSLSFYPSDIWSFTEKDRTSLASIRQKRSQMPVEDVDEMECIFFNSLNNRSVEEIQRIEEKEKGLRPSCFSVISSDEFKKWLRTLWEQRENECPALEKPIDASLERKVTIVTTKERSEGSCGKRR